MSSKPRYVVVVTVEGLGTNLVGCYGGAIAPTKNLDSFACRSIVFDQFWADTFRPVDILESMWTGVHFAARCHPSSPYDPSTLCKPLLERGMLITDSSEVIEESTLADFGSVLMMESDSNEATEDDQTQFNRLFETALGLWATQLDEFPILWIHSRGLNGVWDAPYDYRCVMCDEGDPEPPFSTDPAQLTLTADTDPDEVFGLACCMGAQSMVLDDAWSMIEEILEQLGIADDCLQVLAGVQGYPIGEHGAVGNEAEALYTETLHLPLIVRPGNQLRVGVRVPFMVQPNSILMTMENWLKGHNESATSDLGCTDLVTETEAFPAEHWPIKNQMAYACFEDQIHVAVPAWSCRWSTLTTLDAEATQRVELFATPDDRWQQNEVSQRAVSIVEELTLRRDEWLRCCVNVGTAQWQPLSSELTHPIR